VGSQGAVSGQPSREVWWTKTAGHWARPSSPRSRAVLRWPKSVTRRQRVRLSKHGGLGVSQSRGKDPAIAVVEGPCGVATHCAAGRSVGWPRRAAAAIQGSIASRVSRLARAALPPADTVSRFCRGEGGGAVGSVATTGRRERHCLQGGVCPRLAHPGRSRSKPAPWQWDRNASHD
jgi:hypothetical protein